MTDPFSLSGRHALVTGGTRGIGRAVSLGFARAGASVIANYVRTQSEADSLLDVAESEGLAITLCRADLTSSKGVAEVLQSVVNIGAPLDCLVHCAATGVHKPLADLTTRHFDWTFALNVRAFFELVSKLLPHFSTQASIVAISSQGAAHAVPQYGVIGASKGALESLCRHMAAEYAPRGIRVNILAPGAVATAAWDVMPDKEGRLEEQQARTPLGRLATPDDVALAARFLCSDAASAVVGHTMVVDGGFAAKL